MSEIADAYEKLMRGSFILKQGNGSGPSCWGLGEIFYLENLPDLTKRDEVAQYAIYLCKSCPLLYSCRDYAIKANEQYGIWGGLMPEERQQLKKTAAN